jgi:hypothetical protein
VSSYRNASTAGEAPTPGQPEFTKDVYVKPDICVGSAGDCALDFFSIFMLAVTSHIKSVDDTLVRVEQRRSRTSDEGQWAARVARHPDFESMADLLTKRLHELFPSTEIARAFIIPAFLYHDLLD